MKLLSHEKLENITRRKERKKERKKWRLFSIYAQGESVLIRFMQSTRSCSNEVPLRIDDALESYSVVL